MNWKKRWKAEIDAAVPELSDSVLSTPVSVQADGQSVGVLKFGRKQIISFFAVALAMLLMVTLVFNLIFGKSNTNPDNVFAIEINPAAVFVVDGNGKVKSVSSLNSDADVILSNTQTVSAMVGKPAEQAANLFVEYAAKYGYIDLSDTDNLDNAAAIKISSFGNSDFDFVRSSIENALSQKGIPSVVLWNKTEDKKSFNKLLGIDEAVEDTVGEVKKMKTTYAEKIVSDPVLIVEYVLNVLEELKELEGSEIYQIIQERYKYIDMDGSIEEIDNFISDLIAGLSSMESLRENKFGEQYEKDREPINPEDLKDMHDKIKGDGTLEDFWNKRHP